MNNAVACSFILCTRLLIMSKHISANKSFVTLANVNLSFSDFFEASFLLL